MADTDLSKACDVTWNPRIDFVDLIRKERNELASQIHQYY